MYGLVLNIANLESTFRSHFFLLSSLFLLFETSFFSTWTSDDTRLYQAFFNSLVLLNIKQL